MRETIKRVDQNTYVDHSKNSKETEWLTPKPPCAWVGRGNKMADWEIQTGQRVCQSYTGRNDGPINSVGGSVSGGRKNQWRTYEPWLQNAYSIILREKTKKIKWLTPPKTKQNKTWPRKVRLCRMGGNLEIQIGQRVPQYGENVGPMNPIGRLNGKKIGIHKTEWSRCEGDDRNDNACKKYSTISPEQDSFAWVLTEKPRSGRRRCKQTIWNTSLFFENVAALKRAVLFEYWDGALQTNIPKPIFVMQRNVLISMWNGFLLSLYLLRASCLGIRRSSLPQQTAG